VWKLWGDGAGLVTGNKRYARATSCTFTHQIFLARLAAHFSETLGSLVENSQSQLSRTYLIHQLVLNAPPISRNHVGHAHEVRVEEQSCQGYAPVITCPHFSPVQISSRARLSPDPTTPRRISSQW